MGGNGLVRESVRGAGFPRKGPQTLPAVVRCGGPTGQHDRGVQFVSHRAGRNFQERKLMRQQLRVIDQ